jgi:tetratricopeptide (TPR) repeat protein
MNRALFGEAIDSFSKCVQTDTNMASAYQYRAACYAATGNWSNAIADFTATIALNSGNETNYLNRANAFRATGDLDLALCDFDRCLRLNRETRGALIGRASVYDERGEYAKAIPDLDKALELNPRDTDAFALRAHAHLMSGEVNMAFYDYSEALKMNQTNEVACNGLAWLLATAPTEGVRDGRRAVALAKVACELTGWKSWSRLDTLAAALAESGDFEGAVKLEERALGLKGAAGPDKEKMLKRLDMYRKATPYRAD